MGPYQRVLQLHRGQSGRGGLGPGRRHLHRHHPLTAGTFDGRVTFTGFGSLASAQAIQFQITNPSGGACDTTAVRGPMRCLNINVSPGGQIRVCDPTVTAAKDTRAC